MGAACRDSYAEIWPDTILYCTNARLAAALHCIRPARCSLHAAAASSALHSLHTARHHFCLCAPDNLAIEKSIPALNIPHPSRSRLGVGGVGCAGAVRVDNQTYSGCLSQSKLSFNRSSLSPSVLPSLFYFFLNVILASTFNAGLSWSSRASQDPTKSRVITARWSCLRLICGKCS